MEGDGRVVDRNARVLDRGVEDQFARWRISKGSHAEGGGGRVEELGAYEEVIQISMAWIAVSGPDADGEEGGEMPFDSSEDTGG